ncbi:TPA: hypothetical protein PI645_000746 [Staphylococcus aureus]|nr:hypothetical protein [Staphylococcus aureus]EZZ08225.1 hypothetical protein V048_00461 [Staphylococcus aureus S69_POEL]HDH5973256.1 hypothetical protein [Staphylococcus aureus]HDH5991689.1 hypothetical protein [Staphylococcus aureus]
MLLNFILIIILLIFGDKTRQKLVVVMEEEINKHEKRMEILKENIRSD